MLSATSADIQALPSHSMTDQRGIYSFFAVEITATVLFQKIIVPGSGGVVISLPILYAGLFYLAAFHGLRLNPVRLALYSAFALAAMLSQSIVSAAISAPSLILLYVLYLPFVFDYEVTWETYKKCMNWFLNLMVLACITVIIQDIWQFLFDWKSFPNLDQLLSGEFLLPGFVYIQPLFWGSPYIKPNGFFFLEVSLVSQHAALATIIELIFFQRIWRLCLYATVLLACFAGTGLLMIAVISPFMLQRLSPRLGTTILLGGLLVFGVALAAGWYDQISQRFSEVDDSKSSTYLRFIEPFDELVTTIGQGNALLTGNGAGNIPKSTFGAPWAITKLTSEYGMLTALLFIIFFINSLFEKAPSWRFALLLFFTFNFMGGYLHGATLVSLCFLLGVLLRPVGAEPQIHKSRRAPLARSGQDGTISSVT
jgi:hypothetical protein